MSDKLPPHSPEAEQAVLGCILQSPNECLRECIDKFAGPEVFYVLSHRTIYAAMVEMFRAGQAVDVVTLQQRLKDRQQLEEVGGLAFVSALPDGPSAANLEYYREIVREKFILRKMIQACQDGIDRLYDHEGEVDGVLDEVERDILRVKEARFSETAAPCRPWIEIHSEVGADDVLIGPGRFLTRGSGAFLIAPTGAGKSTWSATQAFTWALGQSSLGFEPTRPLKSVVIQAEDDPGDLRDMRDGILASLRPSERETALIRENVLIVTERARTGVDFLRRVVQPHLERTKADLVWINPLSAYFGADLCDQLAVAQFFRNTLNPMLASFRCLAFIVHHCAKPSAEKKEWTGNELAYFGSGSSDLANWSRETIVLRPTAPGIYEQVCTKRWRKLGWKDADGKPTQTRLIAHGSNGQMHWRDATDTVLEELGAVPFSESKLLELVPDAGVDKARLIEMAVERFAVGNRTAVNYVNGMVREHQRNMGGKRVRCSLLSQTERSRREVYPETPRGRPVIWLSRREEAVNAIG